MNAQEAPRRVWPGANSLKDGIPEGWYTTSEAAKKVGRSKDTLTRWRKDNTFNPEGYVLRGDLTVYLYSDADIEEMQALAAGMKAGRKPQEKEDVV